MSPASLDGLVDGLLRYTWEYSLGDPSIVLWSEAVRRWPLSVPMGGTMLELGCAESDWAVWMKKARPDITIIGVDVNEVPGYGGDQMVVADAASVTAFEIAPLDAVDAVVMLGSLEHFGLGYYGDPKNPHADIQALVNARAWLAPGGWCYYDVPWTPLLGFTSDNHHWRCYSDEQITGRLTQGLHPMGRGYSDPHVQAWKAIRPRLPTHPFWYLIRWLQKEP